jgi:uncharacterized protein involved in exopolysaccharide biosynthesis
MTRGSIPPDTFEDNALDVRRLAAFLRHALRFWPIVLIGLGASALACAAFIFLREPTYRSETVLLYSRGVSSADSNDPNANARNATVRLKELLFSRPKLSGIVAQFGLYREVERKYGPADAVEELKRNVEFRAPGGDTFSIAFRGGSPSEAQQVTAALASVVIDGDAELRKSQAERARDFLASERATKAAELKEAEQRLAAFMGKHQRFALDATPLMAGAAIRATSTPQPTAAAPGGASTWRPAASRVSAAAPGSPAAAAAAPVDAGERGRALAALAAARTNLADLLRRFSPAHPDARAAQREVERATARVEELGPEAPPARPVAAAPAADATPVARAAAPRVAPRAAAPPPAAGTKEDVVALETEWVKLTREVTTLRQRVDQVESALFKADVLASSERAGRAVEITIIDPAYLPHRPVGLTSSVITAIFLAAGLVLGLLGAVLGAMLDDRIYSGADAARITTILAQVPKQNHRRRSYAVG